MTMKPTDTDATANLKMPASKATGNISARDMELLIRVCDNAPAPNAALLRAAKVYCSRQGTPR